jgi:acetyl-CoA acetyltransferase
MATAYIVDAVRTAGGKRGGRLAGVHPVDLGAAVFDAIADRNDFDTKAIDDVITGCSPRSCPTRSPRSPSTASAARRSRRSSSRRRR